MKILTGSLLTAAASLDGWIVDVAAKLVVKGFIELFEVGVVPYSKNS